MLFRRSDGRSFLQYLGSQTKVFVSNVPWHGMELFDLHAWYDGHSSEGSNQSYTFGRTWLHSRRAILCEEQQLGPFYLALLCPCGQRYALVMHLCLCGANWYLVIKRNHKCDDFNTIMNSHSLVRMLHLSPSVSQSHSIFASKQEELKTIHLILIL